MRGDLYGGNEADQGTYNLMHRYLADGSRAMSRSSMPESDDIENPPLRFDSSPRSHSWNYVCDIR